MKKRYLIVAVLVIILSSINTVADTSLIFSDDFNDNKNDGWYVYGGKWSVQDGVYCVENGNGFLSLIKNIDIRDFTVEGDVCIEERNGWAGIYFRVTKPGSGNNNCNGYFAGITNGAVDFGFSDGRWHDISEVSTNIVCGEMHHIKIMAYKSNISIFVDDMNTAIIDVEDFTWSHGMVGFFAHETDAKFDNIRVY